VSEGVGTIRLDRPKMNAISFQVQAELLAVATEASDRDDVHAVVLYGGERLFAAGNDVKEMADLPPVEMVKRGRGVQAAVTAVAEIPKPVVAAVTGYALGGGCELTLAADFRIAADNATFGQPEAMIGLAAGGGSPALLPRVLPPGKALQMLMTGDPITAQEAYRLGMVNELCPQGELLELAHRIAGKIASNSPTAVQAVKRAVQMGQGQPIEQAIAIMMEAHWRSAVHPDRVEGIGAFNDDREPTFQDPDY
jgi:enoyl-CoA hydratase